MKLRKFFKIFRKKDDENKIKYLNDFKVALIADQFTYDSFKFEFKVINITPDNWQDQFKMEKPDLFFCESAWDGFNFNGTYGPWHEKIFKNYLVEEENRIELLDILEYCRKNDIPSIFWNKEDPVSYNNNMRSFADTAKNFDYIFTSASECIPNYETDYNHSNVFSLMFAAQPRLFNPINESVEREDGISFAGSYYDDFPERAKLMNCIFDRLISNNQKLFIHDRNYNNNCRYFPEKYHDYIYPPIAYHETPKFYKKYNWGLNFNTVTDSETMFARRIFELVLSNTNIITNYSKGVEKIFGDNVFTFDKDENLPNFNEEYQQKRLNNLYTVLESHTYKNRWKQILDTIGFEYAENKKDISIIYKLKQFSELDKIIDNFNKIEYENKVLKILVDENHDDLDIQNILDEYPVIDNICFKIDELDIDTEFWIILDDFIDSSFIKKGILHYQYLNKKISICEGNGKFKLGIESKIENKIINKVNLNILNKNDSSFEVYYI